MFQSNGICGLPNSLHVCDIYTGEVVKPKYLTLK